MKKCFSVATEDKNLRCHHAIAEGVSYISLSIIMKAIVESLR